MCVDLKDGHGGGDIEIHNGERSDGVGKSTYESHPGREWFSKAAIDVL